MESTPRQRQPYGVRYMMPVQESDGDRESLISNEETIAQRVERIRRRVASLVGQVDLTSFVEELKRSNEEIRNELGAVKRVGAGMEDKTNEDSDTIEYSIKQKDNISGPLQQGIAKLATSNTQMADSGLNSQNGNSASQLKGCMERGLESLSCLEYAASRDSSHRGTLYMLKNVPDTVHNTVAAHQEKTSSLENDVGITRSSRLDRLEDGLTRIQDSFQQRVSQSFK